MIDVDNYLIPPVEKWFPAPVCIELEYIQGGPKKLAHCFVRANFIKYWPIFKLISLSESRKRL